MAQDVARNPSSNTAVHSIGGTLWFGGWLFTIAFAKLIWWKALLAVVLWPYFLGLAFRS